METNMKKNTIDIGIKLGEQTGLWAANRKELEDIKIKFLEKIRSYDSIS